MLLWDYGSLYRIQEEHYVHAKITQSMPLLEGEVLKDLIVESQEFMRHCALEQLISSGIIREEAEVASHNCVSQRDIQRVFSLYKWLMQSYQTKLFGYRNDYHRRAVLVALGVVYYMRLNARFRKAYINAMDHIGIISNEIKFSEAFDEEIEFYVNQMDLPQGIAKTQVLKENIYATIICTVTQIPLIIVGAPGSSKTLSFNITVANLKGQESKVHLFRQIDSYPSLDPHYYQCSRRTTSNEIHTVFSRAINRQKSLKLSLNINCVVFMDEAGLPEESHESLKVLHYYLDNPEVDFVAISNHVLDAAKTNRAISVFRPENPADDLETLSKGCFCSEKGFSPPELNGELETVIHLCQPYLKLMEKEKLMQFFGLRDFISFVTYLRRKSHDRPINAQMVLEAVERNLNGSDEFETICKQFLATVSLPHMLNVLCTNHIIPFRFDAVNQVDIKKRLILTILRDSIADRLNEVRYKLFIDPSEDDSLVQLLFTFGILDRPKSQIFVCSEFPGDTYLQKVTMVIQMITCILLICFCNYTFQINTIADILHSAIEGHTAVMVQTDSIRESFYDLFNQRFCQIDDSHGSRYYANISIGAHSKPCRIHPEFQCVVVVEQSEVVNTPAPFLKRFEKYHLTHQAYSSLTFSKSRS